MLRALWRAALLSSFALLYFLPEHEAHLVCVTICGVEVLRMGWNRL